MRTELPVCQLKPDDQRIVKPARIETVKNHVREVVAVKIGEQRAVVIKSRVYHHRFFRQVAASVFHPA